MSLETRLPPILSQIDDHQPEVVVQGLLQLNNCLENVDKTELHRRNWALVIYDALLRVIHEKDAKVVEQLGLSLLLILPHVEKDDPNLHCDKMTRYDATLKRILFTMGCSGDWGQKRGWLVHLKGFITRMGHASLHWVDQIDSILLDYVAGSTDIKLWILILEVIQSLIRNTWLKPSCQEWIQIILKILFNQGVILATGDGKFGVNDEEMEGCALELYTNVKSCFELMTHCEDFPIASLQLKEMVQSMKLREVEGSRSDGDLYQHQFLLELDKCELDKYLTCSSNLL